MKVKPGISKGKSIILILQIIEQIAELVKKYGPDTIKLLRKLFAYIRKWGSEGISNLKEFLEKEEKKRH